jgi:hypothetical protein
VTVAVLTSCYGAYDPVVRPHDQNIDVDWICVTDGQVEAPGWRSIIEPRPHLHPRMAAKLARCRPDLYTPASVTIWLDAAARIKTPDTIAALAEALGDGQIAQFKHPTRQALEAEVTESESMGKYHGQPMREQVAHYRRHGLPGNGLWATGCLIRNASPAVQTLGDLWLTEMWRWGWQDQLSEPYALWCAGINPVPLPWDLWKNPHIEWSYGQRRSNA